MLVPFVTVQNVDLNMIAQVEESAPPIDTLSIVCPTTTRDYQISLIESRGPNSRGVQLLRAGLAGIGKTYVSQAVVPILPSTPLNAQDGTLNMNPPLDKSTSPSDHTRIPRPLATREQQIALIESRGPNSRGVRMLHAGLADIARSASHHAGQPMVTPPLETTIHNGLSDGQLFRLYPKYTRS